VTLVVVLALSSLSSVAMSAPHLGSRRTLADLCGEITVSEWDQYAAAIDWAETSDAPLPLALSAECEPSSARTTASRAGLTADSGEVFAQYQAAIEATENGWPVALSLMSDDSAERFAQYQTAIEEAEKSWTVRPSLIGDDSAERFAQYQAAIEAAENGWPVALSLMPDDSAERFAQYQAATNASE
jgi:hypothetical protein